MRIYRRRRGFPCVGLCAKMATQLASDAKKQGMDFPENVKKKLEELSANPDVGEAFKTCGKDEKVGAVMKRVK
jgi:leucyl-tRNA synthetase